MGAGPRQELDEGPDGDPQRGPGACLLPFADGLLVVAERDGGIAVPRVQGSQGDARKPVDEAAAGGRGQGDRLVQVVPGLAGAGADGNLAADPGDEGQRRRRTAPVSRGTRLVRESARLLQAAAVSVCRAGADSVPYGVQEVTVANRQVVRPGVQVHGSCQFAAEGGDLGEGLQRS